MKPFNFVKTDSVSNALVQKKETAKYIAGGTNQIDLMKKNISQPDTLLDVSTALSNKVVRNSKGIEIGAMVRNTAVANDKTILSRYPLISKAILAGASPQIRNMASMAGNMLQRTRCPYFYDITTPCNKRKPGSGCSAINGENRMNAIIGYNDLCVAVHPSDMCVALAALDAEVKYTDTAKIDSIPFKDFHKLPENTPEKDNNLPENAIITSVFISDNPFNENFAYVKIRDRDSYAFALVSVAAALHIKGGKIEEARLASGGVAHKPWRWYEAEEFLKGKQATPANFAEAAKIAASGTKPLSKNGFKVEMLKGAIETALQDCVKI